jgi:hypothetical protein
MKIIPLSSPQMNRWNRWLWTSHGLSDLPGHTVYRCDIDFPMYLTPWISLEGFSMRQERDTGQVLISLDLAPGIRTIANLWAGTGFRHSCFRRADRFDQASRQLIVALREGRLWWGTETLTDLPFVTSVAYLFSKDNLSKLQFDPLRP